MCCRVAIGLVLALALTGVSSRVAAQDANGPDWAFGEPAGEAVVTIGSALTTLLYLLPQNETDWEPSPVRARHEGFSVASDFTGAGIGGIWQLAGSYGLESSYYVDNHVPDGQLRALRSALINVQSTMLSVGITQLFKRSVGRCRPRAFRNGRCEGGEHVGFPSGHTVVPSAIAGSNLLLALRSDGNATHRYLAFGFAEGASVLTALLRVLAGAHSWEDVMAGYFIGHTTGALTSLAHPMEELAPSEPGASSSTGLSWSGQF